MDSRQRCGQAHALGYRRESNSEGGSRSRDSRDRCCCYNPHTRIRCGRCRTVGLMRTLTFDELQRWSIGSPSGVKVDSTDHLSYDKKRTYGCRIDLPSEAARTVAFAYALVANDPSYEFFGALVWYTTWDTGTPQIEQCGLKAVEQMRRGYGAGASIENAPAQLFRTDEMVDAQAFFTLALLWGWDAYYVPHGRRHFAYARQNGSLYLVTDDERELDGLLAAFSAYRPVVQLPTYLAASTGGGLS